MAFLGLLNYARKFIPNLSKLAGPLYSKTTKNGQRNFNKEVRSSIEESLRVVEATKTIDLISPETILKIKNSNKRFIHIGLVVIGVKGLGRKRIRNKSFNTING